MLEVVGQEASGYYEAVHKLVKGLIMIATARPIKEACVHGIRAGWLLIEFRAFF